MTEARVVFHYLPPAHINIDRIVAERRFDHHELEVIRRCDTTLSSRETLLEWIDAEQLDPALDQLYEAGIIYHNADHLSDRFGGS